MYSGDKNPLVILLNDKLDGGLAIAQASHAAYEFGRKYPNIETNNFLYVLRATAEELNVLSEMLELEMIPSYLFREPDLDNTATALSCCCKPARFRRYRK